MKCEAAMTTDPDSPLCILDAGHDKSPNRYEREHTGNAADGKWVFWRGAPVAALSNLPRGANP